MVYSKNVAKNISTTDIDFSHHIQRTLLMQLRQDGPSTYQGLKPAGLEGNAYNYHLRLLKQAGLITVSDGIYQLTGTGYLVTDAFSFEKKRLMLRPHAYTSLFVTHGTMVLLYQATRHPMKGFLSLPSGKLHFGESFITSITKEMRRRNLSNHYCIKEYVAANICYTHSGAAVYHRPGFIWHIEYEGEPAERETESGRTSWFKQNDLPKNSLPEVTEMVMRITQHRTDPIDMTWELD